MKFIVDAQLPKSLTRLLAELGHDAIHTLDMPERNANHQTKRKRYMLKKKWVGFAHLIATTDVVHVGLKYGRTSLHQPF